jgi:hypothetical protein
VLLCTECDVLRARRQRLLRAGLDELDGPGHHGAVGHEIDAEPFVGKVDEQHVDPGRVLGEQWPQARLEVTRHHPLLEPGLEHRRRH